jgi:hypothetical protein
VADLFHLPECEPEGPAGGDDRRHEPRVGCPSQPALRYAVPPARPLRWGYAADVSREGVCFLAAEPVDVGEDVELYALEGPPSCVRVVRVAHCAPTGVGSWRVGCEVSPPFSGEEIASLL